MADIVEIPGQTARVIEAALTKAEERIRKVAVNHGKVERILKDAEGNEVIIGELEFGIDGIYQSLARVNALLDQWNDSRWIDAQKKRLQDQKDKLLAMKAVLEAE